MKRHESVGALCPNRVSMAEPDEKVATYEVIREMRRIKQVLAESMDFDIDRILEDARERKNENGRKILSPPVHQDA